MKGIFVSMGCSSVILLLMMSCLYSCNSRKDVVGKIPESGIWRGTVHLQGQELPFNFRVNRRNSGFEIVLLNGEERISLDEITFSGDSIQIPMHIFDTRIMAKFSDNFLKGYWQKNYLDDYILPFIGESGKSFRFTENPERTAYDISGRWEVYFFSGSDSTLAVGEFRQNKNKLEGTFLKTTGDYRYLSGEVGGDSLRLSTFDGEHAYLFKSRIVSNDTLQGIFWSGKTWNQPWVATRNPYITLPDQDSLTFLRKGYDRIDFQLPDMDGRMVSLKDSRFQNKVVVVQLFGTWCPNCMDETRFLSSWYKKNEERGVEIIAIAFERIDDISYARERIARMKDRLNINYQFLFGGKSDKSVAASVLPMLNTVVSFPTIIIIDQQGKVKKIHTGFSGPGTGEYYEKFIQEFDLFLDKLLEE